MLGSPTKRTSTSGRGSASDEAVMLLQRQNEVGLLPGGQRLDCAQAGRSRLWAPRCAWVGHAVSAPVSTAAPAGRSAPKQRLHFPTLQALLKRLQTAGRLEEENAALRQQLQQLVRQRCAVCFTPAENAMVAAAGAAVNGAV